MTITKKEIDVIYKEYENDIKKGDHYIVDMGYLGIIKLWKGYVESNILNDIDIKIWYKKQGKRKERII